MKPALKMDTSLIYPEAIIFDWDNTLVDSHEIIAAAMSKMHEAFDLPPVTVDQAKNAPQRALKEVFPEKFGVRWKEARDLYNEHFDKIHLEMLSPHKGAHDLLNHLSSLDMPLYVVSNKTQSHLDAEIEALKWDHHFHFIRGSEDGRVDKPDPQAVHHALEDSHLEPETHHIWFVGDSPIDVECALNAGCFPIIIREDQSSSNFNYFKEPIVFVETLLTVKNLLASSK